VRSACGESPSAAAYSASPIPLKFMASTYMPRTSDEHRTAIRAHAVTTATRPLLALRRLLLVLSVRRFPGNSVDVLHIGAGLPH
jgi:hypothetical protein